MPIKENESITDAIKRLSNLQREDIEESLRARYAGATVTRKGKVLIKKGKIMDRVWWDALVDQVWNRRKKLVRQIRIRVQGNKRGL